MLSSLYWLGWALYHQEKYAMAVAKYQDLWKRRKRALGDNHKDTLASLDRLNDAVSKCSPLPKRKRKPRQKLTQRHWRTKRWFSINACIKLYSNPPPIANTASYELNSLSRDISLPIISGFDWHAHQDTPCLWKMCWSRNKRRHTWPKNWVPLGQRR